MKNVQTDVKPG